MIRYIRNIGLCLFFLFWAGQCFAEDKREYQLGVGDSIRISVYRNPDLGLETRITEGGAIAYPLLGSVHLAGLTIAQAEEVISKGLKDGGFVKQPQVSITQLAVRANQVSVLGHVNRPGLYPLETFNMHLTEMLALAGGAAASGGDKAILIGARQGNAFRKEIDLGAIFFDNKLEEDVVISAGDKIYVPLATVFYIYGEVQRPGSFRIDREMSVIQALAQGGGLTARGTARNIELHRRNAAGVVEKLLPAMFDLIRPNDVIYVRESLF